MTPMNLPGTGRGWRETFTLQSLDARALAFLDLLRRWAGHDGRSWAYGREFAGFLPGASAETDVENFVFYSHSRPGLYAKAPAWHPTGSVVLPPQRPGPTLPGYVLACVPDDLGDTHIATVVMRSELPDMTRDRWSSLSRRRRPEWRIFHGSISDDHVVRGADSWWR